jgi:bacteriorhodopsin
MEESKLLEITKQSYNVVFTIMITACLVSIFSTILVNDNNARRILFTEIIITAVSCVMYYLFIHETSRKINEENVNEAFHRVDVLRYNGWGITTPLMLIALCLVLSNTTKVPITTSTVLTIIGLDYIMLLFGYLGELGKLDRLTAMILGFLPFFIIFYIIFNKFLVGHYNLFNYLLFGIYFVIWTGYGISYMFEEKLKNILTNIFDLLSKAVVAFIVSYKYLLA